MPIPAWLRLLSLVSVSLGVLARLSPHWTCCAAHRRVDYECVWPLTAVWSGPLGMWAYYGWAAQPKAEQRSKNPSGKASVSFRSISDEITVDPTSGRRKKYGFQNGMAGSCIRGAA